MTKFKIAYHRLLTHIACALIKTGCHIIYDDCGRCRPLTLPATGNYLYTVARVVIDTQTQPKPKQAYKGINLKPYEGDPDIIDASEIIPAGADVNRGWIDKAEFITSNK